jgi:hypothetical protein
MPSYIQDRAAVYGCHEELVVDPMTERSCTLGVDITVIARMPQKGIVVPMEITFMDMEDNH